jgi:hypothetical protein
MQKPQNKAGKSFVLKVRENFGFLVKFLWDVHRKSLHRFLPGVAG